MALPFWVNPEKFSIFLIGTLPTLMAVSNRYYLLLKLFCFSIYHFNYLFSSFNTTQLDCPVVTTLPSSNTIPFIISIFELLKSGGGLLSSGSSSLLSILFFFYFLGTKCQVIVVSMLLSVFLCFDCFSLSSFSYFSFSYFTYSYLSHCTSADFSSLS